MVFWGICLFDEQGAGKTIMALSAFDSLRESNAIETVIVACPKTMMEEWQKDEERFLHGKYKLVIIQGEAEEKYKLALSQADILVVNFESIPRLLIALEGSAKRARTLLIADESYYVKNPDAQRSEGLRTLRRYCARAFVLCGTPAPNDATDLVHQFDVADNGYTFGGYVPSRDREQSKRAIVQAIDERGVYIRRLKSKTLPNLPEKEFVVVSVNLDGRQAQLYQEARRSLVLWLKGMDNKTFQKNITGYLARREALLQICACPGEIDPLFVEVPAKFKAVDNLLDDLISCKNRKVILWTYYRRSLSDAASRYAKYGLVRVDGTTPGKERREAIAGFQNDPKVKLFLGNPAAAGAGITLHAAARRYLIFPTPARPRITCNPWIGFTAEARQRPRSITTFSFAKIR